MEKNRLASALALTLAALLFLWALHDSRQPTEPAPRASKARPAPTPELLTAGPDGGDQWTTRSRIASCSAGPAATT